MPPVLGFLLILPLQKPALIFGEPLGAGERLMFLLARLILALERLLRLRTNSLTRNRARRLPLHPLGICSSLRFLRTRHGF